MTHMERHFREVRDGRTAGGPILLEYLLVVAFFILVGGLALAEASGMLDGFVHSISFLA